MCHYVTFKEVMSEFDSSNTIRCSNRAYSWRVIHAVNRLGGKSNV